MKPLWPSHYIPPSDGRWLFLERAAQTLGCSVSEIKHRTRQRHAVRRRQAVAYVMATKLNIQRSEIARSLGLRCHSTIIYSIDAAGALIEHDPHFKRMVQRLEMVA